MIFIMMLSARQHRIGTFGMWILIADFRYVWQARYIYFRCRFYLQRSVLKHGALALVDAASIYYTVQFLCCCIHRLVCGRINSIL